MRIALHNLVPGIGLMVALSDKPAEARRQTRELAKELKPGQSLIVNPDCIRADIPKNVRSVTLKA